VDELVASRRRVSMVVLLASSLVVILAVGLTMATMPQTEQVRTAAAAPHPHAAARVAPVTTAAPTTTAAPATTVAPTTSQAATAASLESAHTTVRHVATTTTTVPVRRPVAVTPTTVRPVAVAPTIPPTTVAVPASAAAVLACIRQRESGGNYAAVSANGIYRGAYQFSQSTWNGAASLAGRPDLIGVPPNLVAPANQDAVALAEYEAAGLAPWGGHCP
jgi:hypothetical protein